MDQSQQNHKIIKELGIIGRTKTGYTKKLVLISWYDRPPVYEIRTFTPEGRPSKRAAMSPEELNNLTDILTSIE